MLIQQEHSSDLVHIARDLESSERKPATDVLVENEMMFGLLEADFLDDVRRMNKRQAIRPSTCCAKPSFYVKHF
jgi:hypothetical protein